MSRGQDEPATLGPYHVRGILGRGGMGIVYWGEHRDTGQEVAIKTVEAAFGQEIASIRREIHALGRLRHPSIVQILAQGVDDGRPWYAMELLRGRTLRALIEARRPGEPLSPEELTTICSVMRRLCEALSCLHGAEFVHRDLKPENIFLRDDGTPVLVDFGIAARFSGTSGRDALEMGVVTGSPPYMSPEQIRGDLVDARSDLYALGCIVYECLTGRPPFEGHTPRDVIGKHLSEAPAPPSASVSGIPAALDRLVLDLLAKRPQDRMGYAEDVAAALAAFAPAEPTPRCWGEPYLYRPSFIGRHDVVLKLQRHLGAARRGEGQCVFIGGESGIGKTRLVAQLAGLAMRAGFTVVTGECVALGAHGAGAAPLHPLRPLLLVIADHCRRAGPEAAARILGDRASMLAAYEPALAMLAPEAPAAEPLSALPSATARQRVVAGLTETLLAFAETEPLLLAIDDLQWADELSLRFLRDLVFRPLAGQRMLVVGTYRTDEVSDTLAGLLAAPRASRVELSALDAASTRQVARDMLALPDLPQVFLDFVAEASDGNPFFLAEYLRTALSEGLLYRDAGGIFRVAAKGQDPSAVRAALGLPRSLAGLIERHLAGLDAPSRWLAHLSATLGREVDEEVLRRAADLPESTLMDALGSLRRAYVLEDGGGGRLRFLHEKLRERAYAEIPEDERRDVHARVGRALEEVFPGDQRGEHVEALAYHYQRSGHIEKAAQYAEEAAAKAARAYALDDARRRYGDALALMEQLPQTEDVSRRRVKVTVRWAEACLYEPSPRQIEVLAEAREIAARIGDANGVVRCDYWAGWIAYALGDHAGAIRVSERALDEARALGDHKLHYQLVLNLGQNYAAAGAYDEALAYIHQGISMKEQSPWGGRTAGCAYGYGYLGMIHGDRGEFAEAHAHLDTALAIAAELGRRSLEGSVLVQRAMVEGWQGAFDACSATAERARQLAAVLGAPYVATMSKTAEGLSLFSLGKREEGLALLREAVQWIEATGTRLSVSWSYGALAEALALAGQTEEAAASARAALARAEAGDRIGLSTAHRALALTARGDAAREHIDAALETARQKKSPREEALAHLCAARVFRDEGATATAREEADAAVAAFEAMGMVGFVIEARALLASAALSGSTRAA
ncbi:serine/threonine-protein kinase [Polyangium jinanense]|uniref:Protein kinase n=1 Tax=Polyangium jinanense TaxID=2829994 RepID=A0A9X4AW69_9BACT|nr:serine/threonine-protein kinase [Polyangium jinanense]MDC3961407.1 protein kinase [Polyangium jinanense]MDC3987008.1 protein kinase [Polyangium jinanense]